MTLATFVLRPLTDDDIGPLAGIMVAADVARGLDASMSEDDVRRELSFPGLDVNRDTRVAIVDGAIAGHARVHLGRAHVDGAARVMGYVVPAWRGNGIGRALLSWSVERARAHGDVAELIATVPAESASARSLHEASAFRYVRTFHLMVNRAPAEAEPPRWPDGIQDVSGDRVTDLVDVLVEAHDESFVDHWDFHPAVGAEVAHWLSFPDEDPALVFVAYAGEAIAGYVWCGFEVQPRRGWVHQIGTSRPFRGIGLGRALLRRGLEALASRGATHVQLGVDAENPTGALGLYERNGFVRLLSNLRYKLEV